MPIPSTIDPVEAAHFERLAKLWWDADGPFWPLHRLNSLRLDYIRDHLAAKFGGNTGADLPLTGLRLLDIGCGGGILSEAVARLGAAVHGVDVVEQNIRIAQRHAEDHGLAIRYEWSSAEALAERGEQYGAVLNMEVVEHVADLPLFMESCTRLVRPGGLMVIGTLNRTVASFLGAIVMAEYVLRWLPKGTHHWQKFPTPAELERLIERGGMRVVDRVGVGVNPFGWKFRLTRYMGMNYMLVAEKPG
ncbi:bifunctional 2-polyprenyl-6-hydroxyphenol methylase/3-demethylubiquinol 3-O-methyltransferase UbiG [Methylomagnum sp.]